MIVESKGVQFFFSCLGLILISCGLYGLINFDDMYFNICLSQDSTFYYVLNQILVGLTFLLMIVFGGGLLWLVVYSIKKCREFEEERPREKFSLKKLVKSTLAYGVIIGTIVGLFILVAYTAKDAQTSVQMRGKKPPKKQPIFVVCTAKVMSYKEKKKEMTGPEWVSFAGESVIIIESPEKYKGKVLNVRVPFRQESNSPFVKNENRCRFEISDFYLEYDSPYHKAYVSSDNMQIFPDINFKSENKN